MNLRCIFNHNKGCRSAKHGDLALLYLDHKPLSMVAERFVGMTETYTSRLFLSTNDQEGEGESLAIKADLNCALCAAS